MTREKIQKTRGFTCTLIEEVKKVQRIQGRRTSPEELISQTSFWKIHHMGLNKKECCDNERHIDKQIIDTRR